MSSENDRYEPLIQEHATRQSLRPELVRAVIQVESGFNPRALSPKGAMGLMQLMPATARSLGVNNPWDPAQNIRGGTEYLRRSSTSTTATRSWRSRPTTPDQGRWPSTVDGCLPIARPATTSARSAPQPANPDPRRRHKLIIYKTIEIVDGRAVPRYSTRAPLLRNVPNRQPLKFAVTSRGPSGGQLPYAPPIRAIPSLDRPAIVRSVPRGSRTWIVFAAACSRPPSIAGQTPEPLPQALTQMIESERAFAARALVIGWKQAFLEYFAPDAMGFDQGQAGLARDQIAKNPDPPPDLQLMWEPRFGDMSGSGDLGYLTGPVRNVLPSRDGGRPRHSNYMSVWKRQRDGSFKVVMDVGINTPGPVSFAPGFTRAPQTNRFTGDYDDTTPPLGTADGLLNADCERTSQRVSSTPGRLGPTPSPERDADRGGQADSAVAVLAIGFDSRRYPLLRGRTIRRSRLYLGHLRQQGRPRRLAGGVLRAGLGPGAKRPVETGPGRSATAVTEPCAVQ